MLTLMICRCEQKEVSQQPEAQFVIHAALDLVEEHVWKNPQMYAFLPLRFYAHGPCSG